MPMARLQDWLLDERVLPEATIRSAANRQVVYGGSFDTAILEMGVMTEAAIWTRLTAATGLPAPHPDLTAGIYEGSPPESPPALAAERTRPLRAVPVRIDAGIVKVLCADPVAANEIGAAAAERGFTAELYVVPEVRLFAARHKVYGEPLPGRYAPLWARIRGERRARQPPEAPSTAPPAATATATATATDAPRDAPPLVAASPVAPPVAASPVAPPVAASQVAPPVAASQVAPPVAASPAAAASARPSMVTAAPFDQISRTPLEYFLELSQAVPDDEQLEIDPDVGAQPMTPMADRSSGLVRLEVAPTPSAGEAIPVPHEQPSPDLERTVQRDGPPDPWSDTATEALCRRARDPADKGRTLALRALRRRLTHPSVQDLLTALRATVTHGGGEGGSSGGGDRTLVIHAIEALEELRDHAMIPILIERLDGATPDDVVEAALRALVALSAQNFGRSRRRWLIWMRDNGQRTRVEWLLDGLEHKQADIRRAASEELRHLSGESFGYDVDAPRRERDAARRRWISWWQAKSQERERERSNRSLKKAPDGAPPAPDRSL